MDPIAVAKEIRETLTELQRGGFILVRPGEGYLLVPADRSNIPMMFRAPRLLYDTVEYLLEAGLVELRQHRGEITHKGRYGDATTADEEYLRVLYAQGDPYQR